MNYKTGDLIFVPFPFTDLSGIKRKSTVIISPTWYNKIQQDVVVAAVTNLK